MAAREQQRQLIVAGDGAAVRARRGPFLHGVALLPGTGALRRILREYEIHGKSAPAAPLSERRRTAEAARRQKQARERRQTGIGGLAGAYIGARIRSRMPDVLIRRLVGVLVIAIGARYLWSGLS